MTAFLPRLPPLPLLTAAPLLTVAPHLKSLFQGLDITIFAYGVTGTGKTHTMRGGLKLAERGVIPRLLSGVYRRAKKMAKDTDGETTVSVKLSYYEIYNDKVFDLFEPPEKRTPSGLPLRAEANGKTVVAGLTEWPCDDLKEFEKLYIEANNNRITAATKLNAHSSRSHAILRVKVTQTSSDMIRESTASCIDLAGSEDNRRTENGKERLIESAAINKSLFVLSQCVDAIGRGDRRIPFRESKMTRILSLGQNNGITIMILNLSPLRSYHLDTLSSLTVSSRAKRIEVREIANEVVYKQVPRSHLSTNQGLARQPLRPLANAASAHNAHTGTLAAKEKEKADRPIKAFNVYPDRTKPPAPTAVPAPAPAPAPVPRPANTAIKRSIPTSIGSSIPSSISVLKRSETESAIARPSKLTRPMPVTHHSASAKPSQPSFSAELIEAMVEKKVAEILALRTAAAPPQPEISEAVQKRLDALERRINEEHDESKSEGLRFLLMARQHKERGENANALKMYELALPHFPGQAKLLHKIEKLQAKMAAKYSSDGCEQASGSASEGKSSAGSSRSRSRDKKKAPREVDEDAAYDAEGTDNDGEDEDDLPSQKKTTKKAKAPRRAVSTSDLDDTPLTPHMQELLDIINSKDATTIMTLQGVGPKKARDVVEYLDLMEEDCGKIETIEQLRSIPGMGGRAVERACEGLVATRA